MRQAQGKENKAITEGGSGTSCVVAFNKGRLERVVSTHYKHDPGYANQTFKLCTLSENYIKRVLSIVLITGSK